MSAEYEPLSRGNAPRSPTSDGGSEACTIHCDEASEKMNYKSTATQKTIGSPLSSVSVSLLGSSALSRFLLVGCIVASFILSTAAIAISLGNSNKDHSNSNHFTPNSQTTAQPMDLQSFVGKRIMFIGAHPDDVVGSNGAFVKALSDLSEQNKKLNIPNGTIEMHVLILTNGNAGCSKNTSIATKEECAALRYQEEKVCDATLGIDPQNVVVEQQFDDNHLWDGTYNNVAVVEVIVKNVRRVKPHVIFTFFPDPIWSAVPSDGYSDMGYHPDHQTAGFLATTAIARSAVSSPVIYNASTFGEPWDGVEQLWFWQFVKPTHCFSISPSLMEIKLEAFLQHHTQYQNASQITDWTRTFTQLVGKNCGWGDNGANAEGFQRYL